MVGVTGKGDKWENQEEAEKTRDVEVGDRSGI